MRAVAILAAGAALVALEGEARACSCVVPPPPAEALAAAAAVFEGRVVDLRVDEAARRLTARLAVLRRWKGAEPAEVEVHTISVESMCGYPFRLGETYLVYADGEAALSTGLCTRTAPIDRAGDDLAALGPPLPPASSSPSPEPAAGPTPEPPHPAAEPAAEPHPAATPSSPARGRAPAGCAGCGGASALGLALLPPLRRRRRGARS